MDVKQETEGRTQSEQDGLCVFGMLRASRPSEHLEMHGDTFSWSTLYA